MTATAAILSVFAPLLTALIRKRMWDETKTAIVSVLVVSGLYVIGQVMDGVVDGSIVTPVGTEFWEGWLAAVGGQWLIYTGWKAVSPDTLQKVNSVGAG